MNIAATIDPVHEPSARSDAAYAPTMDTVLVDSGERRSLRRWRPKPGELVSLWDMLRIHGKSFVLLLKLIGELQELLKEISELGQMVNNPVSLQKTRKGDAEKDSYIEVVERVLKNGVPRFLGRVSKVCASIELTSGADQIRRIRAFVPSVNKESLERTRQALQELENRIEDELKRRVFFFVASDKIRYLDENNRQFGKAVSERFPETIADIADACWCLGIARSTAAVYHLMCVVEFGIKRIAKKLGIKNMQVDRKMWGEIFSIINSEIAKLPYGSVSEKDRKDKYQEAMAHLDNVKNAWRNPTMHSRRRYDQTEAVAIFENVKTFMGNLAENKF